MRAAWPHPFSPQALKKVWYTAVRRIDRREKKNGPFRRRRKTPPGRFAAVDFFCQVYARFCYLLLRAGPAKGLPERLIAYAPLYPYFDAIFGHGVPINSVPTNLFDAIPSFSWGVFC